MNNAVGYAHPAKWSNPTVLGTDGIGADMLEEFRLAYVARRAHDITANPEDVWTWVTNGYKFIPESRDDVVTWNYDHANSPWHTAFTPGTRAVSVVSNSGEVLLDQGQPTRVDEIEIRRKSAEAAQRLFTHL
jgi:hypothetical protein